AGEALLRDDDRPRARRRAARRRDRCRRAERASARAASLRARSGRGDERQDGEDPLLQAPTLPGEERPAGSNRGPRRRWRAERARARDRNGIDASLPGNESGGRTLSRSALELRAERAFLSVGHEEGDGESRG